MSDPNSARQPVLEQVLEGGNREIGLLVARGFMPLPPAELVPALAHLSVHADAELASSAIETLSDLDPKIVQDVVDEGIDGQYLASIATHLAHPVVLEAVIRRRGVPRELLCQLARTVPADLQEVLLLRQDAIVEVPEILIALEENEAISTYSERRIREYRDHLLPRERKPEPEVVEVEVPADGEASDEEVAEAIAVALEAVEAKGEVDEDTGLSEGQVRSMPIPVRLKLSRGASRGLRNILIRDSNPMVCLSVLKNNAMSDSELEQIANNRAVSDEVLDAIGRSRQYVRKYTVALALVRNPRTPVGLATRLVPRLGVRDLKTLSKDRNVADAVRAMGARLYKMKRA